MIVLYVDLVLADARLISIINVGKFGRDFGNILAL